MPIYTMAGFFPSGRTSSLVQSRWNLTARLLAPLFLFLGAMVAMGQTTTVTPVESGEILYNPGMGFANSCSPPTQLSPGSPVQPGCAA